MIDFAAQIDAYAAELADVDPADETTLTALVDLMEEAEDRQRRQDQYLARKAALAQRVGELVEAGWPEDEAEAEVLDKPVEQIRRRNFIAHARALGHTGDGFDGLITAMHRELAHQAQAKASDECRGYMDKRDKTSSGIRFWFSSENEVQKHATDELHAWFSTHGRITRAALRDNILSGKPLPTFTSTR